MLPTLGLSIKALKKEPFSGSHCGMRYYLTTGGVDRDHWEHISKEQMRIFLET